MKAFVLFFALAASVAQTATPAATPLPTTTTPAAPASAPSPGAATPTAPPAASAPPAPVPPGQSSDGTLPSGGFPASRYETLWTKSPFAVATTEDETVASPDYRLVGVANIAGISFASVIEMQHQEHFLISSDQATRGLTLTSINRSHDGSDTFAVVQKDGQSITLKLEQASAAQLQPGMAGQPGMQQIMTPQIQMPGAGSNFPNGQPIRPFPRFHRPPIHLPPQPPQVPVQVHPAPPPTQ